MEEFGANYTGRKQCGYRTPGIDAGVMRIGDLRTAVRSRLGLSARAWAKNAIEITSAFLGFIGQVLAIFVHRAPEFAGPGPFGVLFLFFKSGAYMISGSIRIIGSSIGPF